MIDDRPEQTGNQRHFISRDIRSFRDVVTAAHRNVSLHLFHLMQQHVRLRGNLRFGCLAIHFAHQTRIIQVQKRHSARLPDGPDHGNPHFRRRIIKVDENVFPFFDGGGKTH